MGFVKRSAMVPEPISSEKDFIPIAGIKNKKSQGINSKYKFKSANPESTMLKALLKTHNNKPFKIKNTARMLYPSGVVKNDNNSLLTMAHMLIEFYGYGIPKLYSKKAVCTSNGLWITFINRKL